MNKVILIGNLGRDPETAYTQAGTQKCTFSVATQERYTDQSGDKQSVTDWHNVVVWGKLADVAGKYLHKGSKVCIDGKIKTRKYQGKDGGDRYITEVIANELHFLDSKRDDDSGAPRQNTSRHVSQNVADRAPGDDIPF